MPEALEGIDKQSWLRSVCRVELVLLHSKDKSPQKTLEWLRLRPYLTRHHHIRLSASADIARLWRWVSGKAVGLVLSGAPSKLAGYFPQRGCVWSKRQCCVQLVETFVSLRSGSAPLFGAKTARWDTGG